LALRAELTIFGILSNLSKTITYYYYPQDVDLSIVCLQNALHQISSWMTANLLFLNSSKTEFLLIGLKQQFAKLHDCSLNTTHSARYLGFIFDEHNNSL